MFSAFNNFSGNYVKKSVADWNIWQVDNPGEFTLFWENLSHNNMIWVGHYIAFDTETFEIYFDYNLEEKLDISYLPWSRSTSPIEKIKDNYVIKYVFDFPEDILKLLYDSIHIFGDDPNLIYIIDIIHKHLKHETYSYTVKTHEYPPLLEITYNSKGYGQIKVFDSILEPHIKNEDSTLVVMQLSQLNKKMANNIIDAYTDVAERYSKFIINEMYNIINKYYSFIKS
jgi:hypothetical protein